MEKQSKLIIKQLDKDEPINIRHYFSLLLHWLWLFLLAAAAAATIAYLLSNQMLPVYESTTALLVMDSPTTSLNTDYNSVLASQSLSKTYSDMLVNQDFLQEVINRLNLAITVDDLAKGIKISPVVNTQIIEISVQDTNPAMAAQIANTLVQVFLDKMQGLQSDRLSASKEKLEVQLIEIEKQQEEVNKQRLELNSQLLDINNQIKETKNQLAVLEQPAAISTTDPANNNASRLAQITTARTNLDSLQALALQYREMYASNDELYYSLRTNIAVIQAGLADIQSSNHVTQINLAQPSDVPVSPKVMQNTIVAAILGFLLAVGFIFGMDALDDTIHTPYDVVEKLNLPVLGVIPFHKSTSQLETLESPRSSVSESFRSLRTNIQYADINQPIRSILVTSVDPGEGKTTVSANLAVVFANNNKRVYYVDANFHHPTVHKQLDLLGNSGLSQLIYNSDSDLSRISQNGKVPGLNVITSGDLPPNPAEMLGSKRMGLTIEKMKEDSDIILFDTPPVLAVSDAAVLAPSVDAVLLVIKPGQTSLHAARQALEQLNYVNARVIGAVLNGLRVSGNPHSYYNKNNVYIIGGKEGVKS